LVWLYLSYSQKSFKKVGYFVTFLKKSNQKTLLAFSSQVPYILKNVHKTTPHVVRANTKQFRKVLCGAFFQESDRFHKQKREVFNLSFLFLWH